MLVLTFNDLKEQIHIDVPGAPRITLHLLKVQGERVRVGFEAPREVAIVRGTLPPKPPAADGQ